MKYLIVVITLFLSCQRQTGDCFVKVYYTTTQGVKNYTPVYIDCEGELLVRGYDSKVCRVIIDGKVIKLIQNVETIDNVRIGITDSVYQDFKMEPVN